MTNCTLMMLEIGGIQEFIFGSNNLRVNVSSSALISAVTDKWLEEILDDLGLKHNVENGRAGKAAIESGDVDVEAIYIGGGNAFLLMSESNLADQILEQLSTRLLLEAPELRVAIATETLDWNEEILVRKHDNVRSELARRKAQTPKNLPQPGLAVTASCTFTGQPAADLWYGTLISHPIMTRINRYLDHADQYFFDLIPALQKGELEQVRDFEDFSGTEESGYMAIVHADGNRMGDRIKKLGEDYESSPQHNRAYADHLRRFSDSAHKAAKNSLVETVGLLLRSRQESGEGKHFWQKYNPPKGAKLPKVVQGKHRDKETHKEIPVVPFRAVVFGGDDVTFVCDGRLGLKLAQYYLHVYGQQNIEDKEGKAVGRAGVAIVHTHFPFAVGYQLASDLASNAKERGRNGMTASLDWHFGVNGLIAGLEQTRSSSYTVAAGQLQARPLRLQANRDWRSWETFEALVTEFQTGGDWRGRRNKVKALQTALRGGPVHTKAFRTNYSLPHLPVAKNVTVEMRQQGWIGDTCVYFDALEAADFYIPLEVAHE